MASGTKKQFVLRKPLRHSLSPRSRPQPPIFRIPNLSTKFSLVQLSNAIIKFRSDLLRQFDDLSDASHSLKMFSHTPRREEFGVFASQGVKYDMRGIWQRQHALGH